MAKSLFSKGYSVKNGKIQDGRRTRGPIKIPKKSPTRFGQGTCQPSFKKIRQAVTKRALSTDGRTDDGQRVMV